MAFFRNVFLILSALLGTGLCAAEAVAQGYISETRTLNIGDTPRTYLLARPNPMPATALPLVISLHGDGGNSTDMRLALALETPAAGQAVFAYPKSAGSAFEYWSDAGRTHEGQFVQQIIASLHGELGIDTRRVYLAGFSGGATMANALGCRLGRGVIRGLGIHSGTLWPAGGDFGEAGGGVLCDLPQAILIWGMNDVQDDVAYNPDGLGTLSKHRVTQQCAATSTAFTPSPCVAYDDCNHRVHWCAVPVLGHSIWGSGGAAAQSAATAIWNFIAGDASTPPQPGTPLFADGFEGDGGTPPAPGRWVMGYYVGYERTLQSTAQIDFSGLTHLMVGRVTPNADATVTQTFDIDTINGPAWALQAVNAAHAANRKAILMVGGAGEIDGWRAAATPANRATFVANLLATMDQFGADGLDLDWEPIDTPDHAPLLALAQALRAARPDMLLTLPVGWVNTNMQWNPRPVGEVAFLQAIAPSLDRINVMTYEMAYAYEGWHSWFASPLQGHAPNTPSSVASSLQYYRDSGVPAAKLGMGFGFYGNCFRGVTQPRVPVTQANFITSDGHMSYRNILASYLPQMTQHYDTPAQAPWLTSAVQRGPQGCTFVSYESPQSVAAKSQYARAQNLGGTIIWTISQGHIPGNPAGQRDPLLAAIRQHYLD